MNCQEVLTFRMRTATLHVSGLDAVSDMENLFCWLVPCLSRHCRYEVKGRKGVPSDSSRMNCQDVLIFRTQTATLHVSGLDAAAKWRPRFFG